MTKKEWQGGPPGIVGGEGPRGPRGITGLGGPCGPRLKIVADPALLAIINAARAANGVEALPAGTPIRIVWED